MKIINKIKHELLRIKVKFSNYCFGLYKGKKREKKIIVSLTTFPKRIKEIDLCIKSLLLQRTKPDKIIIYLGNDCSVGDVEYLQKKYSQYGVSVVYDNKHNYMSHKKYIYALQDYPNDLVITVDDDLIYPSDMIESLLITYKQYPNAISARRVHLITWIGNNIEKYTNWKGNYNKCYIPSNQLFATTGAGTLFPPNCLPKIAFDFSLINKYALYADDVWIKCMALLNNTKVVWAKNRLQMPTTIKKSQDVALYKKNVQEGKNDEYINLIFKDYGIDKKMFDI